MEATVADANQNTDEPDPPSITPTGGARNYLFLAGVGASWVNHIDSANPEGYINRLRSNQQFIASGATVVAERNLNAASENPTPFVMTAARNSRAATLAVHPG